MSNKTIKKRNSTKRSNYFVRKDYSLFWERKREVFIFYFLKIKHEEERHLFIFEFSN